MLHKTGAKKSELVAALKLALERLAMNNLEGEEDAAIGTIKKTLDALNTTETTPRLTKNEALEELKRIDDRVNRVEKLLPLATMTKQVTDMRAIGVSANADPLLNAVSEQINGINREINGLHDALWKLYGNMGGSPATWGKHSRPKKESA